MEKYNIENPSKQGMNPDGSFDTGFVQKDSMFSIKCNKCGNSDCKIYTYFDMEMLIFCPKCGYGEIYE